MSNTLLGSAALSDFNGFPKEKILNGEHVIFGRGLDHPGLFYGEKPERHFLCVAPTRSGKGVSLIVPNLLYYKGAAIIIDPKGENAWITAQRRRDMGQAVHILDPWGEVNRRYGSLCGKSEEIATFNPLSILDPASEHFADDVAYLADSLIINQGKDPHWDNSARELVAGLIAFAVETKGEAASLPLVRLMLCKPVEEIAGIATEAAALEKSLAAKKLARFKIESKEMAGIVSTAQTQTAFLDSEKLSENMLESSFSFSDLVTAKKSTIFLVLPVDKLQTYGRWLRLMVSIGIRTMARNTAPLDLPVLFVLDEFGTIGKLSAVSQAVGLMAGLQMCVWAFVQDFVQLKRDYPDEWETFIANAGALLCFNLMDQYTAEYISKMLGQSTVERISVATANKREETGFFGGRKDPHYSAMADQNFARPLLTPDEVRRIADTKGLIISRERPIVFRKISFFKESEFASKARHDPHFKDVFKEKMEMERLAASRHRQAVLKECQDFVAVLAEYEEKEDLPEWYGKKVEALTAILHDPSATAKLEEKLQEIKRDFPAAKGLVVMKKAGRFFKGVAVQATGKAGEALKQSGMIDKAKEAAEKAKEKAEDGLKKSGLVEKMKGRFFKS